jgi:hypothetical protein
MHRPNKEFSFGDSGDDDRSLPCFDPLKYRKEQVEVGLFFRKEVNEGIGVEE